MLSADLQAEVKIFQVSIFKDHPRSFNFGLFHAFLQFFHIILASIKSTFDKTSTDLARTILALLFRCVKKKKGFNFVTNVKVLKPLMAFTAATE